MIQLTPQMRILVATEPADFRKGIDGLARLCQETLKHDPFSGWVFVFRNRRGDRVKILWWDRDGYALWYKRLEKGTFKFPSVTSRSPARMSALFGRNGRSSRSISPQKVTCPR